MSLEGGRKETKFQSFDHKIHIFLKEKEKTESFLFYQLFEFAFFHIILVDYLVDFCYEST